MQAHLPNQIDLWKLAAAGSSLQGSLPQAGMTRLAAVANSLKGMVAVDLHGGTDEQGRRFIAGELKTCVEVVCQRCLEPLQYSLNVELKLGLIRSEAQATHLPAEYDPLLALETGNDMSALVEDELILALPFAPMHNKSQSCKRADTLLADKPPATKQSNPFAVLATLRDKSSSN